MKKINVTTIAIANIIVFIILMMSVLKNASGDTTTFNPSRVGIVMILIGCLQIYFSIRLVNYRKEISKDDNILNKLRRISDDVNSESPTYEFKHSKFDDDISEFSDDKNTKD